MCGVWTDLVGVCETPRSWSVLINWTYLFQPQHPANEHERLKLVRPGSLRYLVLWTIYYKITNFNVTCVLQPFALNYYLYHFKSRRLFITKNKCTHSSVNCYNYQTYNILPLLLLYLYDDKIVYLVQIYQIWRKHLFYQNWALHFYERSKQIFRNASS